VFYAKLENRESRVIDVGCGFMAWVREVRIYPRALTQSEIKALHEGKEISNEGLVLYLKFDEGSGSIAHDASQWRSNVNCIAGNCLRFDGVDDYVEVPDSTSLDITNAITISAWINVKQADLSGYILSKDYGGLVDQTYAFCVTSGNLCVILNNTQIISDYKPSINEWHQVAVSWDGSSVIFYVNGSQVYSSSFTGPLTQMIILSRLE
jgi:hypothetical protein